MFAEIIDQFAGSSHTRKSAKGRLVLWLRLWQVCSKYVNLVTAYFAKLLHLTAYHASDIMNATLKVRLSDRTWCGALLAFMLLWRCSEVSSTSWYGRTIWVSDWMWWCSGMDNRCLKCPIKTSLLIIPRYQKSSCFLITRCDQCSAERSVDEIFEVEKQLTEEIEVNFLTTNK